MGIFSRLSDIVSANISDLLDRAEDPEKMIKLMIIEMEEHLQRAHEGVVKALAGEKRLEQNLNKNKSAAAEWQAKAEAALERCDEEQARKCLTRKMEYQKIANSLQEQFDTAHRASEVLKEDYCRLEEKVAEARRRRDALIARQMAAEAQKEVAGIAPAMAKAQAAFGKFDRMEQKIEQIEAEALALADLAESTRGFDREFEKSQRDAEVDAELAALKEKAGKHKESG